MSHGGRPAQALGAFAAGVAADPPGTFEYGRPAEAWPDALAMDRRLQGTPIATNAGMEFRLFASRGGYREVSGASGLPGRCGRRSCLPTKGQLPLRHPCRGMFPAPSRHSVWRTQLGQAVSGRGFAADAARSAHRLPDQSARSPRMRTAPLSAEEAKAA
ncbi:hypothetical protein CDV50_03695 [Haematobacter massiliensis]|nr:hypothetical protein CDV50_03695 [Haematobacter massiliensis]OWJ88428.1 hypothetical protein CDV51_01350 [Haematobacter massiliensis]